MVFDAATLTLAGGFVTVMGGMFLFVFWAQDRASLAALWWAVASCAMGVGICLLALHDVLPWCVAQIVGPTLLDLSPMVCWAAARVFNGKAVPWRRMLAFTVGWLVLIMTVGATLGQNAAACLGAATSAVWTLATAVAFWQTRDEALPGRFPVIGLLCMFAAALVLVAVHFATTTSTAVVPGVNLLGAIHLAGLFFAVGTPMFLVMMLKERHTLAHRTAARVDPLTGLPNRRDFMEHAQRAFRQCARDDLPVAVLAFDLDRFKSINDGFGHAAGDQVLCVFANVITRVLRGNDVFGRLGGEEFAAVLPGCGVSAAMAVAGRIRVSFQQDARFVDGQRIAATVSVGVAIRAGHAGALADLLASADGALYRSKRQGRNRVTLADDQSGEAEIGNVVRIA